MMLKLFVWRGPNVLRCYSSGIAFALADSAEQARLLVRQQWDEQLGWTISWYDPTDPEDQAIVTERLAWLQAEPEVFFEPVGFIKNGGE